MFFGFGEPMSLIRVTYKSIGNLTDAVSLKKITIPLLSKINCLLINIKINCILILKEVLGRTSVSLVIYNDVILTGSSKRVLGYVMTRKYVYILSLPLDHVFFLLLYSVP